MAYLNKSNGYNFTTAVHADKRSYRLKKERLPSELTPDSEVYLFDISPLVRVEGLSVFVSDARSAQERADNLPAYAERFTLTGGITNDHWVGDKALAFTKNIAKEFTLSGMSGALSSFNGKYFLMDREPEYKDELTDSEAYDLHFGYKSIIEKDLGALVYNKEISAGNPYPLSSSKYFSILRREDSGMDLEMVVGTEILSGTTYITFLSVRLTSMGTFDSAYLYQQVHAPGDKYTQAIDQTEALSLSYTLDVLLENTIDPTDLALAINEQQQSDKALLFDSLTLKDAVGSYCIRPTYFASELTHGIDGYLYINNQKTIPWWKLAGNYIVGTDLAPKLTSSAVDLLSGGWAPDAELPPEVKAPSNVFQRKEINHPFTTNELTDINWADKSMMYAAYYPDIQKIQLVVYHVDNPFIQLRSQYFNLTDNYTNAPSLIDQIFQGNSSLVLSVYYQGQETYNDLFTIYKDKLLEKPDQVYIGRFTEIDSSLTDLIDRVTVLEAASGNVPSTFPQRIFDMGDVAGALVVDLSNGSFQKANLVGNITSVAYINTPPPGYALTGTIELSGSGFTINWANSAQNESNLINDDLQPEGTKTRYWWIWNGTRMEISINPDIAHLTE